MDNKYVSGMGKKSITPEEIKGWNWGAFLLNWIWGIGNSTYIALLMFIPFVNLVMLFILGTKGNEWAWQNRTWRSIEHFKSTQKKWRNAGLILIFVIIPVFLISLMTILKGEAYKKSISVVVSNPQVIEMIGKNPSPSFWIMGVVSYESSDGMASLNYTLNGDKGNAEVYVYAINQADSWELKKVLVISKETGKTIYVIRSDTMKSTNQKRV
ncbi:MAG: cytochrome c oxidase assembly factor 1 family protein [Epsilonproteobacteria bacterium]|nr:cytochrome c oxidase assembly factor 1 family protein [Campylobacterota bacterium]